MLFRSLSTEQIWKDFQEAKPKGQGNSTIILPMQGKDSQGNPITQFTRLPKQGELGPINIPGTDINLEVDAGDWAIVENDNLDLFHHDRFLQTFQPADKLANNYLEFVIDSINSDYVPIINNLSEALIETAEEFIEKEISLTFKGKVKLIWDLKIGRAHV